MILFETVRRNRHDCLKHKEVRFSAKPPNIHQKFTAEQFLLGLLTHVTWKPMVLEGTLTDFSQNSQKRSVCNISGFLGGEGGVGAYIRPLPPFSGQEGIFQLGGGWW